jgi:hypothetical protein
MIETFFLELNSGEFKKKMRGGVSVTHPQRPMTLSSTHDQFDIRALISPRKIGEENNNLMD